MTASVNQAPGATPALTSCPDKIADQDDQQIISHLLTNWSPPTSEKNVWAYWHTGFKKMPKWTQRNVVGWVRRLGPSWTVRVLDRVPGSQLNVERFLGSEYFPPAFNENRMTGNYVATHSADLVRLPLLYLYGGMWMDVNTILIRDLGDIWELISTPTTSYELAGFASQCRPNDDTLINNFLVSRKGNEFIKRWHQIFVTVWGDASECVGFHRHPLLRHQPMYSTAAVPLTEEEKMKYEGAMMDYGTQVLCAERLRDIIDPSDGFDGRRYFEEKIFFLHMLDEMFLYQTLTNFDGQLQFDYLMTRPNAEGDKADSARAFVQQVLSNTTMIKFCHGPKGVHLRSLAHIWDDPQYEDSDVSPGTLGELLRSCAATQIQERTLKSLKPQIPSNAVVHRQGVLEPFL